MLCMLVVEHYLVLTYYTFFRYMHVYRHVTNAWWLYNNNIGIPHLYITLYRGGGGGGGGVF